MVLLGRPEPIELRHFGDDRIIERTFGSKRSDYGIGCFALCLVVPENRRPILRTVITTLAVTRRRIVDREENFEDLLVRDLRRIELQLHDFSMTGRSGANSVNGSRSVR